MNPKISLIAAISKNRALGRNNDLIWRIPDDLKRFRKLTEHHPIIMGRKTYESIGRPLPHRTNIIVTRDANFQALGCVITHSLNEALAKALEVETDEIFIIGGGQIFEESIKKADKLYLTVIDSNAEGDVYFPDYSNFHPVYTSDAFTYQGLKYKNIDYEK